MCSLSIECVLVLENVFSYSRTCSLSATHTKAVGNAGDRRHATELVALRNMLGQGVHILYGDFNIKAPGDNAIVKQWTESNIHVLPTVCVQTPKILNPQAYTLNPQTLNPEP